MKFKFEKELKKKCLETYKVVESAVNLLERDAPQWLASNIDSPSLMSSEFKDLLDKKSIGERLNSNFKHQISVNLLKIQILGELHILQGHGYMMRVKTPKAKYPKYYVSEDINFIGKPGKAEVIFFANSENEKTEIKAALKTFLCGHSLQEVIYYFIMDNDDILMEWVKQDNLMNYLDGFLSDNHYWGDEE